MTNSYPPRQPKGSCKTPGYGTIREICSSLGYTSDLKDDPKYFHSFRSRVSQYRHAFINTSLGLAKFPLNHNNSQVKKCVSGFMDQNPTEFAGNQDGTSEKLAKLMCMQEYYTRKNNLQLNGIDRATSISHTSKVKRFGTVTPSIDSDADYEECSNYDLWDVPPSPPTLAASTIGRKGYTDESSPDDDEDTEHCTKRHLDLVYPLDGMHESRDGDWLLQTGPQNRCPIYNLPYISRYLHEHNLYTARKSNMNEIEEFANDLMRHLNVKKTDFLRVFERCKQLVKNNSSRWQEWGLLVGRNGVLSRTVAFEAAWKLQKQRWIDEVRGPTPDNAGDFPPPVENETSEVNGRKRSQDIDPEPPTGNGPDKNMEDATRGSTIEPWAYWRSNHPLGDSKRQKRTPFQGFQNFDASTSIDLTADEMPHLKFEKDITDAITANSSSEQYRAPVARMNIAPQESLRLATSYVPPYVSDATESPAPFGSRLENELPGLAKVNLPSPRSELSTTEEPLRQNSPQTSSRSTPYFHSTLDKNWSINSMEPETSTSNGQLPSPPLHSPIAGTETARSETTSSCPVQPTLPPPSAVPNIPLTPVSEPITPPNIPDKPNQAIIDSRELHFIIEKSPGNLDKKKPIPKDTLYALAIPQLFSFICSRSGQAPESVTCLTFRYHWDPRVAEVIERSEGEDRWEELKSGMMEDYIVAREEHGGKKRFEIWVKSGRQVGLGDGRN